LLDPYTVSPQAVFLDGSRSTEGSIVEIHAEAGIPLAITRVDCDVPVIEATVVSRPPLTTIVVRLKHDATFDRKTFSGVLRVATRSAVQPEIRVPVSGRLR